MERFPLVQGGSPSVPGAWRNASVGAGVDPAGLPNVSTIRAQIRRLFEIRIDDLPEPFRMVFVLRDIEAMSVEDTAEHLGIAPAMVRTRTVRARALLRESLARDIDLNMEAAFSFAGEHRDQVVADVLAKLHRKQATNRPPM